MYRQVDILFLLVGRSGQKRACRRSVYAACGSAHQWCAPLGSVEHLEEATIQPKLQKAVRRIHDAIAEGSTLDQAMSKEPSIFSELTLSMIRAGQEGAFLEEALQRTAAFLRKQDEMQSKIIGALTYPIILGIVGTVITALMIVFLVPKFQPFFDRLEQSVRVFLDHGFVAVVEPFLAPIRTDHSSCPVLWLHGI